MRVAALLVVAGIVLWPILATLASPLLAGRDPLWLIGGLAGVVGMALLMVQPILAPNALPLHIPRSRQWHRLAGWLVAAAIVLHVAALYAYSPDDIADALLLQAPTPFSVYGVIGLVGVVLTIGVAVFRRRLPLGPRAWRLLHSVLALIIVSAGAIHALMIEGAMEPWSKMMLAIAAIGVTGFAVVRINRPVFGRWGQKRGA